MAAPPTVDEDYLRGVSALRTELKVVLQSDPSLPLVFLRLALNDQLEWCKTTKTGGANGSVRSERELRHAANANLTHALRIVEEVKAKHGPVTFADTIALAGLLAAEALGCPGPLAFVPGRRDSRVAVPEGRLPTWAKLKEEGAGAGKLREVLERVDLPLDLGVALLGLHPYGASWEDPLAAEAAPGAYKVSNGFFQSVAPGAPAGSPAALLASDPQLLALAQRYAGNNDAYLAALGRALEKASLLGTSLALPSTSTKRPRQTESSVGSAATGPSTSTTSGVIASYLGIEEATAATLLCGAATAAVLALGFGIAAVVVAKRRRTRRMY